MSLVVPDSNYNRVEHPPLSEDESRKEIGLLRGMVKTYEERNLALAKNFSELEVKWMKATSGLTFNDSDAIREMKEMRLFVKEISRQLKNQTSSLQEQEKDRALKSYWERQTDESERGRSLDKEMHAKELSAKEKAIQDKDERIRELEKKLEFMTEKADALEHKLVLADDKNNQLEKKNAELGERMRNLAKACEDKIREFQKEVEKKIKQIYHNCRTKLRIVRKFSETKVQEIKRRVHMVVGKKMTRMATLIPKLTAQLNGVKEYYHDLMREQREDFEEKERSYIMKILGIKEGIDKANIAMDKMGYELEEMTKKADGVWSHLRAVLSIKQMELKIEELGKIIAMLKGKITKQGKKLERTEMARLDALDVIQVRDEELVVSNNKFTIMRDARRTLMYMLPRFVTHREPVIIKLTKELQKVKEAHIIELRFNRSKIAELESLLEASEKANVIKAKIIRERNEELDQRSWEIARLVIKATVADAISRSEIARLHRIILGKNKEIAQLKLDLAEMIELMEDYKAKWEDAECRCVEIRRIVELRDFEITELKETLRLTIEEAKAEALRYQGIIRDKNATIKARDATIVDYQNRLKRMTEKADDLREQRDALEEINSKKNAQIRELDLNVRRLKKKVFSLEKTIRQHERTIIEWKAKHYDMKKAYGDQLIIAKNLQTDVEHIERRLEHNKAQIAKLEKQKKSVRRELEEHRIEYKEFVEEAKQKEEALHDELETAKEDYEVWIADLNAKIESLKLIVTKGEDAKRKLHQALRVAEQKLKDLERVAKTKLSGKEQELILMQLELRKSKQKVMKALNVDHFATLKKFARFMDVEKRGERVKTQEKKLTQEQSHLQTEKKFTRDTMESLSKRCASLTEIVRQLLEQLTATDQAINRIVFSKPIEQKSEAKMLQEIDLIRKTKSMPHPGAPSPRSRPETPIPPRQTTKPKVSPYNIPLASAHTMSSLSKLRSSRSAIGAAQTARQQGSRTSRSKKENSEVYGKNMPGSSRVPSVTAPQRRRPNTSRENVGRSSSRKRAGGNNNAVLNVAWDLQITDDV